MTFTFACRHCGGENRATLAESGRAKACAACGRSVVVPAPAETADGSGERPASGEAIRFACPDCGRKYATKPELLGKKIKCGGCGKGLVVGGAQAPPPAHQPSNPRPAAATAASPAGSNRGTVRPGPPATSVLDLDMLLEGADGGADLPTDVPELVGRSRLSRRPGGGEAVESVLPSRSAAMADLEEDLAAKAEVQRERDRKRALKAKAKGKKTSGGLELSEVFTIIGFTLGSVVVIGFFSWMYPGLRFPVGASLAGVGFLGAIFGTMGFAQAAREEGYHHALLCRFVPLYKLYFLLTRWEMMKGHFAFYAAGLLLLSTGGVLLKTTPFYMERDRAGLISDSDSAKSRQPAARTPPPAVAPTADESSEP